TSHTVLPDSLGGIIHISVRGSFLDADHPATGSILHACSHIHTILTDNGIQFAEQPRNRNTAYSRQMRFDMICEANGIEHRLTKPNHPWTNGQVERMNRTIKEATVKRFHYENHDQLRTHLSDFMAAYNFARRLKTLNGLTPYEYICKIWTSEPDRFILNPIHQMPGLNT
ncbi:integrase core domain-containing protein, partial [Antarcticimicrobium sediminis]|uniref:integrase core domain-containing protein n=1 Tax=Antarcticimicrobium sediminis TaxID=2546227 RepID=UPI001FDEAB25